jgi:hypothetical protein
MTKTREIDLERRRTVATTFRGDARSIATLVMFFADKGEPCRTLSEVLRLAVESMREMIVAKEQRVRLQSCKNTACLIFTT